MSLDSGLSSDPVHLQGLSRLGGLARSRVYTLLHPGLLRLCTLNPKSEVHGFEVGSVKQSFQGATCLRTPETEMQIFGFWV